MVDSRGITVPVARQRDHGTYEGCNACIEAGFSSIMFDGSHYSIEENVEKTKELVALAHAKGLSIEAEVGSILSLIHISWWHCSQHSGLDLPPAGRRSGWQSP